MIFIYKFCKFKNSNPTPRRTSNIWVKFNDKRRICWIPRPFSYSLPSVFIFMWHFFTFFRTNHQEGHKNITNVKFNKEGRDPNLLSYYPIWYFFCGIQVSMIPMSKMIFKNIKDDISKILASMLHNIAIGNFQTSWSSYSFI